MSETPTIKLCSSVARSLTDHGIDTLFGVAGDLNVRIAEAFRREQNGTYIAAANEAGAVLMAIGHSRISGKVGVATVTRGPGLTNTVTSLVEAARAHVPVVVICGVAAHTDRFHPQEIDHAVVAASADAGYERLRSPTSVCQEVAVPFRRAAIEERAIVLDVPKDFLTADVTHKRVVHRIPDRRLLVPESDDINEAVGILAAARSPIIVAGRGAIAPDAREAIRALAERSGALLATTLLAKGLFEDDPCNLGIFGTLSNAVAVEAMAESDCVLFFGASLSRFTTDSGKLLDGKRTVQIGLDAQDVGRRFAPTVGIVGDAGRTADVIRGWLDAAEIPAAGFRNDHWRAKIADHLPESRLGPDAGNGTVDIRHALFRLNQTLPRDRILVTDGGRFMAEAWRIMQAPDPSRFIKTTMFGAIGMGVPYAIGACLAEPSKPVILVAGDGGFMLGGLAEFNTAVRYGLNLLVVLCNDGGYGAEADQLRAAQLDSAITLFDWPDFADVARSLGGRGMTVRSEAELETVAARFAEAKGPMLVDIRMDPDRIPRLH